MAEKSSKVDETEKVDEVNGQEQEVEDDTVAGYGGAIDQLTGDASTNVGRAEDGALHLLTKDGELTDVVLSDPDPEAGN